MSQLIHCVMASVVVSFSNCRAVNGWQVSFRAQHESFIGLSPGCETSRAEIVIPVASEMGQVTGGPYRESVSRDVYSLSSGE